MPEIVQNWLSTRLGVIIDLTPQKFGRNTKDGVLLGRLLYSYGVIPVHVLEKVKESRNYYDCLKNLHTLRPWLEHIGVTQDDSAFEEVARGEGSFAISLFYAVYLNLERKDRLYYLSAQKERKFSESSCRRKFKVDWVPEKGLRCDAGDSASPVDSSFLEKQDMIEWHRSKCREVVENIRKVKAKFLRSSKKRREKNLGPVKSKHTSSQRIDKCQIEAEETKTDIGNFERKHMLECPNLSYTELIKLKNTFEEQAYLNMPSSEEARNILCKIKQRRRSEVYARNFQENMQTMVLDEQWKEIVNKQNQNYENTICDTLLKQSQYEKQMATKLCQVRNQKKVCAENRNLIECLKMEQRDRDYDNLVVTRSENKEEYLRDREFERERTLQLHYKVHRERLRRRRMQLKVEAINIIYSIADIAIRVSEIREMTHCEVPKALMRDFKELFFKNQPIIDSITNIEELYVDRNEGSLGNGESEGHRDTVVECNGDGTKSVVQQERVRHSVLNEADFFDYTHLLGPWMVELLFPDSTETEIQQLVLGYVVHKLLEIKYPFQNRPMVPVLKPMKPTAIVQNLDGDGLKMLSDLMEPCGVLVVNVSDAINHILSAYKEEMSIVRDIDITFRNLTQEALKCSAGSDKGKEVRRKQELLAKEEPELVDTILEDQNLLDKETQTPKRIPDDDPLLSATAQFGKIAFENLGAGDPVPDDIVISAITCYVQSKQEKYDGWILVNYPQIYMQASELEFALTGYRLLQIDETTLPIDTVERFNYRTPFVNPFFYDENEQYRTSKLVAKPYVEVPLPPEPRTYFDYFLWLKKANDVKPQPDPEPAIVDFYTGQNVFTEHEYPTLNFQTVKNIGKTILSEVSCSGDPAESGALEVEPKTSVEIFGSFVTDLNDKWDPGKKKNGKVTEKGTEGAVKKVRTRDLLGLDELNTVSEKTETNDGVNGKVGGKRSPEGQSCRAKPGDSDWEWATGEQSEELLMGLANLWENMEAVFIQDLKDVFFALRAHRANVISYCAFIRKSIQTIIRQPDEKQKVLSDFQQMFNEIDEDLRPDLDIKCELHVRVSELEEALMSFADQRKMNSLKDISNVAQDGWAADEIANLVNQFLAIVQLEADRGVDTYQVLTDYYSSLQGRTLDERTISKITVAKLQIKDRKYSVVSTPSNWTGIGSQMYTPRNSEFKRGNRSVMEQSSRGTFERSSKTRSWTDKRKKPSDVSFLTGASQAITDVLTNFALPADGMTPFHNFFKESVHTATTEMSTLMEGCLTEIRKGDKSGGKNAKKAPEHATASCGNAVTEWESAAENELNRFLFRMKLILARGIFDLNEFLATILNTLSDLTECVNEMYLREVGSISECCKVFRCAIEEEIPIQPQLELKEDVFCVNECVLLFPKKEEPATVVADRAQQLRFTVEQLFLLHEKLHSVAPDGEIIKRSLLYILEDLRALNAEIKNCNCFPMAWKLIEPSDMVTVLNEIYQDLEIVPWRDFIIYALEIPTPSEQDILSMRKLFRQFDPCITELVSREDYEKIHFWFEGDSETRNLDPRHEMVKCLLFKMFQVDDSKTNYSALLLALCKDENPIFGFTKALALVMGKQIITNEYADDEYDFMHGEGGRIGPGGLFDGYNFPLSHSRSSESLPKCYSADKVKRCHCSDVTLTEENEGSEDTDIDLKNRFSVEGENMSLFLFGSERSAQVSATSTIPCNVLSSLLKASFPSLPQLTILLECSQTFQDTVNGICDSLEAQQDQVEVYKLLRHKFISRLLQSTNKFRSIKLTRILANLLKSKDLLCQSFCFLDRLNCGTCLD